MSHKAEHSERVRFLTPEEERKLRGAIRKKYSERLAEFELALHTGLRVSEQYGALWEQVDWQHRILTVPIDKGGHTSHLPLNAAALAALSELCTRAAKTGVICGGAAGPRVWFEASLKAAGIADFSWHCLRHTFASRLVMSGADIRTVAELLRDRTLAMAMRYAHLAPDYRMEAVQRMQDKFNPEVPSANTKPVNSGTESDTGGLAGDGYLQ